MKPKHIFAETMKPKRPRTRFLVKHIVRSDYHGFIGRIYDLGILSLNFETYDELAQHPDCKYAYDTKFWLSSMTQRVESLNLVGQMLWPDPLPKDFSLIPLTRYEWLTATTDIFLVRLVSIIDCALLLVNQIFELELKPESCTLRAIKKAKISAQVIDLLGYLTAAQESLRQERNRRIHHGNERAFTDDDTTFKVASIFNDRSQGMIGRDYYGRRINVDRSFREGLVGLQRNFNQSTRQLVKQLDELYDLLWEEFEDRFGPRIAAATHGLNSGQSFGV